MVPISKEGCGVHNASMVESALQARWVIRSADASVTARLEAGLGIHPLLAVVLANRGLTEPEEADKFLKPSLEDLHDPMLLPDCEAAVREILRAKELGETVYVHGDYDVDGVTSAAIFSRSLSKLGLNVISHVPHRIREGYGIHEFAIEHAKSMGAGLFLTCDCGTTANEMIEMARATGMRVVVTDHHQVQGGLPDADAVVNPHRRDSSYPFPELSGAGVAFKVAQATAEACGVSKESFQRAFLDLAALGTLADIVPLTGENRILVTHGLARLSETKKVGLRALMEVAGIQRGATLTSFDVGFKLGPRINAAGRVDDADVALRLLLTDDPSEARELAKTLDSHNQERRRAQQETMEHAQELVERTWSPERRLIFVWAEDWPRGVVGIVAGKLAEAYSRPALVASMDAVTRFAHGSGRSIPGFSLFEMLEANSQLFESCGGHEAAVGFQIDAGRLEEAAEALEAFASKVIRDEDLVPTFEADARIRPMDITLELAKSIGSLAPFGVGNPEPLFAIFSTGIESWRAVGNGQHAQFRLGAAPNVKGIGFGFAERFSKLEPGQPVDLLVNMDTDRFNGNESPQARLVDLRVTAECAER